MSKELPNNKSIVNNGRVHIPLVDCEVTGSAREQLVEKTRSQQSIQLTQRDITNFEMIAIGGYSPLSGFMTQKQYNNVIDNMRLPNGIGWTIPITLSTSKEKTELLQEGTDITLLNSKQEAIGVLHLEEKYIPNRRKEAIKVYGTEEEDHPGAIFTLSKEPVYLGGSVSLLRRSPISDPVELKYAIDPKETRKYFKKNGWQRIVGFQTRNPPHRGHEYIQKAALEICDGIFLQPLIGETKEGDIASAIYMRCYERLLKDYYPSDRVFLGILPAPMHYAGPREAIHHAIIRRNYGCTHFIIGRDHAGVGNYYGTYDAHYIFKEFDVDRELGIRPLFFDHAFYCRRCENMTSYKTCPHGQEEHIILSGTKVRSMLEKGEVLPKEFMRPEILDILVEAMKKEIMFMI